MSVAYLVENESKLAKNGTISEQKEVQTASDYLQSQKAGLNSIDATLLNEARKDFFDVMNNSSVKAFFDGLFGDATCVNIKKL